MSKPWKTAPLGDLCDNDRDITYGIVKVGDYIAGGVPVIRGGDIRNNRIIFNEEKRVSPEISNQFKRTILHGGEIVMNLIAEPGHSAVVPNVMKGFNVSRDVAVIPLSASANHVFVNCFLKSPEAVSWLSSRLNGSVTQKINLGILREIPVPIPPRWYQDAVAALLGALDEKIDVNDRIADTASDLISTLYLKALVSSRPATIKLTEAVKFTFGLPFASKNFNSGSRGRPLLRIRDIKTFVPQVWTVERLSGDEIITPGDVVAGMDAEFRPTFWLGEEALLNQRVLMAGSLIAGGGNSFVREVLRDPLGEIEGHKTGTTVIHLNKSDLDRSWVEIPSTDALDRFEAAADPLRSRIVAAAKESRTLTKVRETLLPKLTSGEIRVREAEEMVAEVP